MFLTSELLKTAAAVFIIFSTSISAHPHTDMPSQVPSVSSAPSYFPSVSTSPSSFPSNTPSLSPSMIPSSRPSTFPSTMPSLPPSIMPSKHPSSSPSNIPSASPSISVSPSYQPSISHTPTISIMPSAVPSMQPSCVRSKKSSKSKSGKSKKKSASLKGSRFLHETTKSIRGKNKSAKYSKGCKSQNWNSHDSTDMSSPDDDDIHDGDISGDATTFSAIHSMESRLGMNHKSLVSTSTAFTPSTATTKVMSGIILLMIMIL